MHQNSKGLLFTSAKKKKGRSILVKFLNQFSIEFFL